MTDKVSNDAAALIGAFDVEDYVAGDEFRGDGGDYMPNDQDRSLLIDAIHGAIGEMQDNLRNAQSEAVAVDGEYAWGLLRNTAEAICKKLESESASVTIFDQSALRESLDRVSALTHPAPQSEAVAVTAIEWHEITSPREDGRAEPTGDYEAANGLGSFYYIRCYFGSDSYGWEVTHDANFVSDHDNPEAAKESAFKHHMASIRSALTHPAPPLDDAEGRVQIIEQSDTMDGGTALTLQLDDAEAVVVVHFGRDPAPPLAVTEGAAFLLDRLDDFERDALQEDDGEYVLRQFAGHVSPAAERLRAALTAALEAKQ